jgi:hypothetical protein
MCSHRHFSPALFAPAFMAVLGLAAPFLAPLRADEKVGMPDLSQVDQTCLPTSTANLILWFGKHGYPRLIMKGATEDERESRTVHQIMADTDARFDWGTRMDEVTVGIKKYIHDAGYQCDVEYRGLEGRGAPFEQDWLKENDAPNKGFILLLLYCHLNPMTRTFTPAWGAGHAVTLVNPDPDAMLIHDPAHEDDETGRKIVTPHVIPDGTLETYAGPESVAGLMLLSGSLLEAPGDADVMLSGAVCVTMHPPDEGTVAGTSPAPGTSPTATLAGTGGPSAPMAPVSTGAQGTSWWMSLFDFFFTK